MVTTRPKSTKFSREIDVVIEHRAEKLAIELELESSEKRDLLGKLATITNRTYLWVHLIFEVLTESIDLGRNAFQTAIDNLPKSINEAYEKILGKSCCPAKAKKLLHIVVAANRPLSVSEMAIASVIGEHDRSHNDIEPKLEPEGRFRKTIREICGLFVVIVDFRIYLLHQTAREFLIRSDTSKASDLSWQYSLLPKESNRILSEICIRYLHFADLETSPTRTLLDYSAHHWTTHFYLVQASSTETDLALELCTDDRKRRIWLEIFWKTRRDAFPANFTPLMAASYFGLQKLVSRLVREKTDLALQDAYGRTALSWASENGHEEVVELLLSQVHRHQVLIRHWSSRPTMANSKDRQGRTPLALAAANGHEAVAERLLDKGAKVDSEDDYRLTPLSYALYYGHEAVVGLLLASGASHRFKDLKIRGNDGVTPWERAIVRGDEAMVRLLLDRGTNIETRDDFQHTALIWAAGNGHEAVTRLLPRSGRQYRGDGQFPPHSADTGRLERPRSHHRLLLDQGANIEANINGSTSLIRAAGNGHEAVTRLLLDRGANIEANINGSTSLIQAAGNGHEASVLLLLDRDANIEATDGSHRTALIRAAWNGHEAITRLLLDRGAKIETKSKDGRTALAWAILHGHDAVARLLLDRGASFEALDAEYLHLVNR